MRNFVMWQKHGDALLADDVQVGDHAAPAASEYLAVYEQMMGLMPGTVRASSSHEREWDSALAEAHRLYDARCDADDEGQYDEGDDHWVPERLLDPFLVESQYEYAVVQSKANLCTGRCINGSRVLPPKNSTRNGFRPRSGPY